MKPEPLKNKFYFVVDKDIHTFDEVRNAVVSITKIVKCKDIKSAVKFYKEWKEKSVRTFIKEYPEYHKEWLKFYASFGNRSQSAAWDLFILNKSFDDVTK